MLRPLRRAYRRRLPRRLDPWLDEELRPLADDPPFEAAYRREVVTAGGGPGKAEFLAARYREGMRWRSVLFRLPAGSRGARPVAARVLRSAARVPAG